MAPDAVATKGTVEETKAVAKEAGEKTKEVAKEVGEKTKDGAVKVGEKTKEGVSKVGAEITDAFILGKVKAQFVGEDVLKGSDINVDCDKHIVTLRGTVPTAAARARAIAIAKSTDGVRSRHRRVDDWTEEVDGQTSSRVAVAGVRRLCGGSPDRGEPSRDGSRQSG